MLKVLSNILCDLDPKVKVIGQKAGICDGVPSTSALVMHAVVSSADFFHYQLFLKILSNTFSVKQFWSRSGQTFGWACDGFKLFTADTTSRHS